MRVRNRLPGGKIVIYILLDPLKQRGYVGASNNFTRRFAEHLYAARTGGHCYLHKWIRKLWKLGLQPQREILEHVPHGARWQDREKYWIWYLKEELGFTLVNHTEGGTGGGSPGRKWTEGQRRKFVLAATGKTRSDEQRQRISDAHKGIRHSEKVKKKMSKSHTGKIRSEEHCKSLALAAVARWKGWKDGTRVRIPRY